MKNIICSSKFCKSHLFKKCFISQFKHLKNNDYLFEHRTNKSFSTLGISKHSAYDNLDFQREMILTYFNQNTVEKQELQKMFESYIIFSDIDRLIDEKKNIKIMEEFKEIINAKDDDNNRSTKEEKINVLFDEIKKMMIETKSLKEVNTKQFKSIYYDLNTANQYKKKALIYSYKSINYMHYFKRILEVSIINLKVFFQRNKKPKSKEKYVRRGIRYDRFCYLLGFIALYFCYKYIRNNESDKKLKIEIEGKINGKVYQGSVNIDGNSLSDNESQMSNFRPTQSSSLQTAALENFPQLFNKKDSFTPVLQTKIKTKLHDVKGIDEVKDEIEQLIRIIKNPEKYKNAGAKLPKGILLVGKPGTGKTLLAKAIAGDSKVNFISTSGSDFEEMYVGVGSTRIKKLFTFAKENSPCIIFIDEIDALLTNSKRSDKEHSSSRSTINTFLTEMDGFNKIDGVFVIGATNHEKDLDSAAVRPGRFDKRIHVNLPSINGREEIADFYLNKIMIPKTNEITKRIISQMTTGFTGAEIENLINMSGIMAINNNDGTLDLKILTEARDRILMGISNKYTLDTAKRRYMTAVHEMGHTLTCYKNNDCRESLLKVTIVPSGPALGVTQRVEVEDTLYNKDYYLYNIDMALGGHIAEKILFGEDNVTAGCSSDLSKATQLARKMVNEGFYAKEIGYLYVEQQQSVKEEKLGDKYKEVVNKKIDEVLNSSHDRVVKLLENNSDELIKLSRALFKYNTLDVNEITLILENRENEMTRPVVRQDFEEKKF